MQDIREIFQLGDKNTFDHLEKVFDDEQKQGAIFAEEDTK